jgi:hypothetical protein
MDREETTARIVETEWEMFQKVSNIGGRAACQDEWKTFEAMRRSQVAAWSEKALESYLKDLVAAEGEGRNLLTEKYGRMMKSTSPAEYGRIEHLLPALGGEVLTLIDSITAIVMRWEKELADMYPSVLSSGRPIHSSEDSPHVTSFETYLRGELSTYSVRTHSLLLDHFVKLEEDGINGSELTLAHTVRLYGYGSLEEAEAILRKKGTSKT